MDLWRPSPDQAQLFDWWRPLLAVSRRARADRFYWPVYVEEFEFKGRFDRGRRPAVWVYEHRGSGGDVLADWPGRTYEFIRYRTGRQLGRFHEIDVRTALWRARLPDFVEPVTYDEPEGDDPQGRPLVRGFDPWSDDGDQPGDRRPRPVVRRGHLSLVPPFPNLN